MKDRFLSAIEEMVKRGWELNDLTPIHNSGSNDIVGVTITVLKENPEYWALIDEDMDTADCPRYLRYEETFLF